MITPEDLKFIVNLIEENIDPETGEPIDTANTENNEDNSTDKNKTRYIKNKPKIKKNKKKE